MPPGRSSHASASPCCIRELLRRAGRWAELLTVDLTDEEAHLGVAQDWLAGGSFWGLRQLDVLEQVLRDEMGIGPAGELRPAHPALDTPTHARPTRPRGLPRAWARQMVHFCCTSDGVRLAYATSGAGPLVKASNWMTHLYDWASPVWSHWWRALSEGRLLVRHERGCGYIAAGPWTPHRSLWMRGLTTSTVTAIRPWTGFPLSISQGGRSPSPLPPLRSE